MVGDNKIDNVVSGSSDSLDDDFLVCINRAVDDYMSGFSGVPTNLKLTIRQIVFSAYVSGIAFGINAGTVVSTNASQILLKELEGVMSNAQK